MLRSLAGGIILFLLISRLNTMSKKNLILLSVEKIDVLDTKAE